MKIAFIKEKSCRVPTVWGWIALGIVFSGCFYVAATHLNSFLSFSKPVDAQAMVVEGWLPTSVLAKAAEEFRAKGYSLLFSTGIKIDRGDFYWQERTYADMGAAAMVHLGLDSHVVKAVPASLIRVDRTFASACALKRYIDSTGLRISAINIVSLGPHSRRSKLLFQKALGKGIRVGVYSYPDETYDPKKWWRSSNGFKSIVDEAVSYCYTKYVFWIKKSGTL